MYFGSEAYYLGRTPQYISLLLVAGLALVISGVMVVGARRPTATPRDTAAQQSK